MHIQGYPLRPFVSGEPCAGGHPPPHVTLETIPRDRSDVFATTVQAWDLAACAASPDPVSIAAHDVGIGAAIAITAVSASTSVHMYACSTRGHSARTRAATAGGGGREKS